MKIVVDTNIVFSAILNTQNKIGQLLINGCNYFEFYSVELLKEELHNHQDKLLKISGYPLGRYQKIHNAITSRIRFINDVFISDKEIEKALILTKNIDENDTLFVALANQMNSIIWTGDKKLISGLRLKGYDKFIVTEELYKIFLEFEYRKRK